MSTVGVQQHLSSAVGNARPDNSGANSLLKAFQTKPRVAMAVVPSVPPSPSRLCLAKVGSRRRIYLPVLSPLFGSLTKCRVTWVIFCKIR
jgi:hypothetical protein